VKHPFGGFDFVDRPVAADDVRRMSLAEFTRLYLQSRLLFRDPRDGLSPQLCEPYMDEDKLAAQVIMAILKSRA
jgi:hypothetical protein